MRFVDFDVKRESLWGGAGPLAIRDSDVIDAILRFLPQVVIAGELSVNNVRPTTRLLNTGHGGFLTTGHANSAMDGFAVRHSDVADANPDTHVTLRITQEIAAGSASQQML